MCYFPFDNMFLKCKLIMVLQTDEGLALGSKKKE